MLLSLSLSLSKEKEEEWGGRGGREETDERMVKERGGRKEGGVEAGRVGRKEREGGRKKKEGGEERGGRRGREEVGSCNVKLADEIMLISIISLIVIFAHAPALSNLIYTKHAQ